jgi:hypothetical protein
MSAFMVGKVHIDAMVTAAMEIEHERHTSGLSWYWFDPAEDNELVRAEISYCDQLRANEVGQMLWAENLASINARYPDTIEDHEHIPGPCDFRPDDVAIYVWENVPGTLDPLAIIDATGCYEYQSCEHEGWRDSQAKAFCGALTDKMLRKMPRQRRVWEITDRRIFHLVSA